MTKIILRGQNANLILKQTGRTGPQGPQGPAGEGVPTGGTTGEVLTKTGNTDYDTEWTPIPSAPVDSVNGQTGVVVLDAADVGADVAGSAAQALTDANEYTDEELENYVAKGELVLNVKDFGATGDGVTDDAAGIQAALDAANAAGGGYVYAPAGTYTIESILTIGSSTTFELSSGTTIKRNATINAMIVNKSDGTTGGYGQASNIRLVGGCWDGNMDDFPTVTTVIAIGHSEYISIENVEVKNVFGWHHIELNAVRHGVVKGCVLKDFDNTTTLKEMLQLDLMVGAGAFPWFGPYDNTACDDILIDGNSFVNGCRGVGSHSAALGSWHTNVRITNNHFENFREDAIVGHDYQQLTISNNTMDDCQRGIWFTNSLQISKGYAITGNVMRNFKQSLSGNSSRGITIKSATTDRYTKEVIISDNEVMDCASHGIGADLLEDVQLTGNVVSNCGRAGIWVWRSIKAAVSDNVLRGNDTAAIGSMADLNIGADGTGNETQDVVVTGNVLGKAALFTGDRYLITNNILDDGYTISSPTNTQILYNFISGVWTPGTAFDNKVDKTSIANRAYGTDGAGNQFLYTLSNTAIGNGVIRRDINGRFSVLNPNTAQEPASKNYVDGLISPAQRAAIDALDPGTASTTDIVNALQAT